MKNEKNLFKVEIFSTIFIMILGTILHFTYEWSNNNLFVGLFSAVNESVWEHLKLIFFPMFITTIIGSLYFKDTIPNYLCIKTKGILLALSFLIIFFYTYTGIIGKSIGFINIISFFVAVILGEYYTYKKLKSLSNCNQILSFFILIIILFCFIIFTIFTPHIGLFKDPISNNYGRINHI